MAVMKNEKLFNVNESRERMSCSEAIYGNAEAKLLPPAIGSGNFPSIFFLDNFHNCHFSGIWGGTVARHILKIILSPINTQDCLRCLVWLAHNVFLGLLISWYFSFNYLFI